MPNSIANRLDATLRERAETGYARQAKADLRKAETRDWRPDVGRAIQRALSLVGWSLKEASGKVNRDPRQVARWLDGSERPQMDVLFSVEELRQPLVIALAELAGGVEVETHIRIKRTA